MEHNTPITDEMLEKLIEKENALAEKLIGNPEKLEKTLKKFEEGLGAIPIAGHLLQDIPVAVSMVRSYIKKEYTEIPIKTIVAVTSGILYVLAPIDLIPDVIPGIGFVDDIAVLTFVLTKVHEDVKEYREWKENNNK